MSDHLKVSKQTIQDFEKLLISNRKMILSIIYYKYMSKSNIKLDELIEEYCQIKNIVN